MTHRRLSPHELANLSEPSPHQTPPIYDAELDAQVEDCHSDNRGGPEAFFVNTDDDKEVAA